MSISLSLSLSLFLSLSPSTFPFFSPSPPPIPSLPLSHLLKNIFVYALSKINQSGDPVIRVIPLAIS